MRFEIGGGHFKSTFFFLSWITVLVFIGISLRSCSGWPTTIESYQRADERLTTETILYQKPRNKWTRNKYVKYPRKGFIFSNKKANALVSLFSILGNTLNSNTTFNSLDRVTAAFNTMTNSYGFFALAAVINLLGNTAVVFDAIGNGLERTRERILAAIGQSKQPGPEEFQDELKLFARNLAKRLTSINNQLSCGFPLLDDENQTNCLPSIIIDDEDSSNEDEDY